MASELTTGAGRRRGGGAAEARQAALVGRGARAGGAGPTASVGACLLRQSGASRGRAGRAEARRVAHEASKHQRLLPFDAPRRRHPHPKRSRSAAREAAAALCRIGAHLALSRRRARPLCAAQVAVGDPCARGARGDAAWRRRHPRHAGDDALARRGGRPHPELASCSRQHHWACSPADTRLCSDVATSRERVPKSSCRGINVTTLYGREILFLLRFGHSLRVRFLEPRVLLRF
mmetsp:Transcript_8962/g.29788  ORF Transcript_8962/g.29788 Transcript_8962/m.29788 type:complete len:234 (+) Transcript_8962:85-786(+)